MMRILICLLDLMRLLDLVNSPAIFYNSFVVSVAAMLEKISCLLLDRCSCSYEKLES